MLVGLLTCGLALLVRAIAAHRSESLWPDGVIELEQAQAFAEGRWADGIAPGFHPLYSLLVSGLLRLGAPAEAAGQALAALLSALVAPLVGASAGLLVSRPATRAQAALAAGVLAALTPLLARLGGQVLAYGPAHAALAAAVWCGLRAAGGGAGWALGCGAAIGAGYLCRSDALATGAGLALGLALQPGPGSLGRARRVGLLGLGLLVVATPYLIVMRLHAGEWRLSLKKQVSALLELPGEVAAPAPSPPPPEASEAPLELAQRVRLEELGGQRAALAPVGRTPLGEAGWFAARKLLGAAHPLVGALALIGLLLLGRRPALGLPALALALPALALLGGWAGQTLLRANYGYTGRVHASFAGVLLAPLAGVGLVLACAWLARRLGVRVRLLRSAALALAALALLGPALEPQREGRGPEREIGRALRDRAGPGPLLICGRDTRVPAWHAGATYMDLPPGPPAESLAAARARGARWLLVHLRWLGARPEGLEAALGAAGLPPPLRWEDGRDAVHYVWLAWDLRPGAPPPAPPTDPAGRR